MSPFSPLVLGSAAVVSAPALWSSLVTGTVPVADGLLRYVVVVAGAWIALSLLAAMVGPAPRPVVTPGQPSPSEPNPEPTQSTTAS